MTNGRVIILGRVGKNFGAGMSGGVAYIYDQDGVFEKLYNSEMVVATPLSDSDDEKFVQELIYKHIDKTESDRGKLLMADWPAAKTKFLKVSPKPIEAPAVKATAKAAIK
jgi:glutamate synthase domain-containing protein 3